MPNTKKHSYDYPRPALTADVAVVTLEQNPHVLLIRRKGEPYAGKWALPGGFVEENEPLMTAALRELQEETGVELEEVVQVGTYGDPGRDPRGWTVSVVYLAEVEPDKIQAKAADDAEAIGWFPLSKLPRLAFDHAKILKQIALRYSKLV